MKLYELADDFAELFDSYESISSMTFEKNEKGQFIDDDGNVIDPEAVRADMLDAWFDTLDGIDSKFEQKAENIGAYIKQLKAEEKAIADEKKKLEARLSVKTNEAKRLEKYLLMQMQKINLKNIDMPKAKIAFSDGKESVCISNESELIRWAEKNCMDILNPQPPKIAKKKISAIIKDGTKIPYAEIIKNPYITIK